MQHYPQSKGLLIDNQTKKQSKQIQLNQYNNINNSKQNNKFSSLQQQHRADIQADKFISDKLQNRQYIKDCSYKGYLDQLKSAKDTDISNRTRLYTGCHKNHTMSGNYSYSQPINHSNYQNKKQSNYQINNIQFNTPTPGQKLLSINQKDQSYLSYENRAISKKNIQKDSHQSQQSQCQPKIMNQTQRINKQFEINSNRNCNLCNVKSPIHKTKQCPYSIVFYYPTSLQKVSDILVKGLVPQKRQLGRAVYVTDEPLTSIKYVQRNKKQYDTPVLLKLKANANQKQIRQIKQAKDVRNLDRAQLNASKIQCIKYPIYKLHNRPLYMIGMYKCDYAIVGFSPFDLPKNYGQEESSSKMNGQQKAQTFAKILATPCGGSGRAIQQMQDEYKKPFDREYEKQEIRYKIEDHKIFNSRKQNQQQTQKGYKCQQRKQKYKQDSKIQEQNNINEQQFTTPAQADKLKEQQINKQESIQ